MIFFMFKETYLLFFTKVFSAVLGFLVSATIARGLNTNVVGEYFFIISLSTLFIPVTLSGLGHYFIKNYDIDSYNLSDVIGFANHKITKLSFLCSIIIFLYSCVVLDSLENINVLMLLFSLLLILLMNSLCEFYTYVYQSFTLSWKGTLNLICMRQIFIIIFVYNFSPQELIEVLILYAISSSLSFIFGFIYLKRKFNLHTLYKSKLKISFKDTKDYFISHILGALNGSLLPILVTSFSSPSENAYFSVSIKIAAITSFILIPINRVVAPRYSKFFRENDIYGIETVARYSARVAFIFTLPIVVSILLFSNYLLGYFGNEYIDKSTNILYILMAGQFINCISGSVGWLMQMTGKVKEFRDISLWNVLLSLLIGIASIPIYGGVAAAYIYSFSLIVTNVSCAWVVKKEYNINIYKFW